MSFVVGCQRWTLPRIGNAVFRLITHGGNSKKATQLRSWISARSAKNMCGLARRPHRREPAQSETPKNHETKVKSGKNWRTFLLTLVRASKRRGLQHRFPLAS